MSRPCRRQRWRAAAASRRLPSGKHVAIAVAVKEPGFGPAGALLGRGLLVEGHIVLPQHYAVVVPCASPADKTIAHVGGHPLGLAVKGMTPTAAASRLDAHDIPALDHVAIAERMNDALIAPTRIYHSASGTRGATARYAPQRILYSGYAHGAPRLPGHHLNLPNKPTATAPAARPTGIGVDGIAPDAHGKDLFEELGGKVFLCHQIHGVIAIRRRARAIADAEPVGEQKELARGIASAQIPDHISAVRGHCAPARRH